MTTTPRIAHSARWATAAVLAGGLALGACGSASSGSAGDGTYRGVQIYKRGENVYVCRDAPTAPTLSDLTAELRRGGPPEDPPTGQSVEIVQRDEVEVDGSTTVVARVRARESGATYWIPYTALCSRGGGG